MTQPATGPLTRLVAIGYYVIAGEWPPSLSLVLHGHPIPRDWVREALAARLLHVHETERVDAMTHAEYVAWARERTS
jgi:hypothetical protein